MLLFDLFQDAVCHTAAILFVVGDSKTVLESESQITVYRTASKPGSRRNAFHTEPATLSAIRSRSSQGFQTGCLGSR
jgi:hypothetical protein